MAGAGARVNCERRGAWEGWSRRIAGLHWVGSENVDSAAGSALQFHSSEPDEAVVPDSGHWIMEENPKATIEIVRSFLD